MIKRIPATADDPVRYRDEDNARVYRSVVGGLAWPAKDAPGYLVILGHDLDTDESGNRHYWVVDEAESSDLGALVRLAIDRRKTFSVQDWVGNTENKPAMYLLHELMQPYHYKERLSLDMAPYAGDSRGLSFYLPLIKSCTSPVKLLHFGDSKLPGYLAQMRAEDLASNPEDFPPIAALGYALLTLYTFFPATQTNFIDYSDRPGGWML